MDRTKTVACLSLVLLASCSRAPRIVVGSKNFTEQIVLGEILAQQIERRMHVRVERQLNLGGTLLAHEALVKGDIDLYPEYTGTGLTAVLKQAPQSNPEAVLGLVRDAYKRWKLEWLTPLGFNDTFAMIVRGDTARQEHLANLSDAAARRAWKMGVGYEFKQRADGLDGFLAAYRMRTDGDVVTMDLGLLYSALQSRKVDLIAANSTDGLASALDVTFLEDDRHFFPPYQCAVVIRDDTLQRFPELRATLEELSGKLSDSVMRRLNYTVDGQHRAPAEVAADYLKALVVNR